MSFEGLGFGDELGDESVLKDGFFDRRARSRTVFLGEADGLRQEASIQRMLHGGLAAVEHVAMLRPLLSLDVTAIFVFEGDEGARVRRRDDGDVDHVGH
jgi:hypothetical protein